MSKNDNIEIGYVIEINGERALVALTVDATSPVVDNYYPGQPGSYVKISFPGHRVIGLVSSIKMENGPGAQRAVADSVLLGTFDDNGKFVRGVSVYPNVGQKVYLVTAEELNQIFSEYIEYGFSFGRASGVNGQRVYVQVDKFFGQHIAVLGTTGCGKSCTVVSILQQAIKKYPETHIIVLDLHGEYAAAFPDGVNIINSDNLELPYWLLNFDEFVELTVDPTESTAKNQITVLRDSLMRARQAWDTRERLGFGNLITADSPVYFDLDDMISMVRDWNIQMVYNAAGEQEE